jgi:hypothetical protein
LTFVIMPRCVSKWLSPDPSSAGIPQGAEKGFAGSATYGIQYEF